MNMTAPKARVSERVACNIEAKACSTIFSQDARIVDISPHGAQVFLNDPYEPGSKVSLDVDGEAVWGVVAWNEVDRMGVRFIAPVSADHWIMRLINAVPQKGLRNHQMPQMRRAPVFGRRAAA